MSTLARQQRLRFRERVPAIFPYQFAPLRATMSVGDHRNWTNVVVFPVATVRTNAGIAQFLRELCAHDDRSDGQLLRQFLGQRDEAAFRALVERHGPMVLGVCRRVLGHADDADDAFQASFLVLARRAASLAGRAVLGDWLHGVARRTALNARRLAAKRRIKERAMARPQTADETCRDDWLALLDEELARLPEKYRLPIVLCELEGHTRREAAERLGWRDGTVAGRLARGRALLADRLTRRGVALSAGGIAAALSQSSVSAALAASTTKAVVAGSVSALVALLTQHTIKSMFLHKLKAAAAGALVVLASAALCYGVLAAGRSGDVGKLPEAAMVEPVLFDDKQAPAAEPVDQFGDPLPPEALARLGTIRLRHGSIVLAIVFAPDGKSFASAGSQDPLHIWEIPSGKELVRIESHRRLLGGTTVDALAYTPDGKFLAGTRLNEPPCLWEASTGKLIREFGDQERRGQSLTMSADGKFMAYGGWPNGTGPWWLAEVDTGKELCEYDATWSVFSPDSKTLAYGGAKGDAAVHLVDASTGKEMRRFDGHQAHAIRGAFSPDGSIFATTDKQTLRMIELANGRVREFSRPEGQYRAANTLAFSPDGKTLAAVGAEGKALRILDIATGKSVSIHEFKGKREHIWSILFTKDNKTVISGHEDGYVRFWEASTAAKTKEYRAHTSAVSRLALSPDGQILATTSWAAFGGDCSVRLWETATGKSRFAEQTTGTHFVVFSPDGRRVATGDHRTDTTQLWEAATGKLIRQWDRYGPLAFTTDGMTLICGSRYDGKVHFYDLTTGEDARQIQADSKAIYSLRLSRDGSTLVTFGSEKMIRLWDPVTGRQLHNFGGAQKDDIHNLALAPDGKILTGNYRNDPYDELPARNPQKAIIFWETNTGKLVKELIDPESRIITGLAFSGDGKRLASGHLSNRNSPNERGYYLRVRDVVTGKNIANLATDPMDVIAYSPDGRTLIGGGQSRRELYLWEVATGQLRRKFAGHQGGIATVAFAPNGRAMASGGLDGTVLIWDVTGARSRQMAAPELSADRLNKLWDDLAAEDAVIAYDAIRTLRSASAQAAALLAQHLKPAPKVDPKRLAAALANLDSDDFKTRDAAKKELEAMVHSVEAELRRALANQPTVEAGRRLEQILSRLEGAQAWRTGRALEVLEHIGDGAARRLLTSLAQGEPQARITQEARAALERMDMSAARRSD